MKKVLEHDRFTGITTTFEQEESTGVVHVAKHGDAQAGLDYAKALANDPDYSKEGIKKGFWHYAHIPAIVMEQLYKHGINPYAPGTTKAIIKYINENCPHLKTTDKRHA